MRRDKEGEWKRKRRKKDKERERDEETARPLISRLPISSTIHFLDQLSTTYTTLRRSLPSYHTLANFANDRDQSVSSTSAARQYTRACILAINFVHTIAGKRFFLSVEEDAGNRTEGRGDLCPSKRIPLIIGRQMGGRFVTVWRQVPQDLIQQFAGLDKCGMC